MTEYAGSYAKVFYDLRPAKQVERRMIVDALLALSEAGLPVRDHHYVGLGSIYFFDFILFHKYLGIERLTSVEGDRRIAKRAAFNKPFDNIELRIDEVGNVLPTLDRDERHFVWLDYDGVLTKGMLADTVLASQVLSPGSLLLVTVDVDYKTKENPAGWQAYYESQGTDYLPWGIDGDAFARSSLPVTTGRMIENAIKQGLAGREKLQYFPLFSFHYADGHEMLTIGGLIGSSAEGRMLEGSTLKSCKFARLSEGGEPFHIGVPRLTKKERMYLDQNMPLRTSWTPADFELSVQETLDFASIYRFYPLYAELLG